MRRNKQKCNFSYSLYLRLFFVMGCSWTSESISWIAQSDSVYFVITDVLNLSQGFIIFILFVLKPDTISRLRKR